MAEEIDVLNVRLSLCVEDVKNWMIRNRLCLNADKTEIIILGSMRRLKTCPSCPLDIADSFIPVATSVRNLGFIIDSSLTFTKHVTGLTSTLYYYIRQLRTIRKSLSVNTCHALVRAMILSRLDYCNGLLVGAPAYLLKQMDGVMRAAARLILQLPRICSVTLEMRQNLHWLDISSRIDFKMGLLAYRCIHGLAPTYLMSLCLPVSTISGRSHLRSAASGKLVVPVCRTSTFGPRAFAVACPTVWNELPEELRGLSAKNCSLLTFRKKLKTHLFNRMLLKS